MPFTVSHVVAVLPVAGGRRWLPLAPAALGAMVPDVGLFLGLERIRALGHEPAGILLVDLPLVVLLGVLWAHLLRPALLALVPPLAARWPDDVPLPASPLGRLGWALRWALAAVVGAATHLVLDAFTHRGLWGEANIPELSRWWHGVVVLDWLQWATSAVGMALLVVVAAHWWWTRRPDPADRQPLGAGRATVLLGMLAVVVVAGLVRAAPAALRVLSVGRDADQWHLRALVTDFLVGAGATAAVVALLVAVALRLAGIGGRRPAPAPEREPVRQR